MSDGFAIKVENVSKSFKLPHEKQNSLKSALINFHKRGYEIQTVLNNISFEVEKGDFFGIVGRNGSGKSTLLKLMSGIYTPNSGEIHVRGSLTPFIELGVGFNPELSGRENVFLNGALLGFNHKEMEVMYKDIVAFAELERFMDQKLKNYSSGMQVRLAFSIAIRAQSDILLLDEVLAVGDEAFQKKCYKYFEDLKSNNKTVILVTHDMDAVERFCNKALLIEKGDIVFMGDSGEVAQQYRELFKTTTEETVKEVHGGIEKVDFSILQNGKKTGVVEAGKPFEIGLDIHAKKDMGKGAVWVNIVNSQGVLVSSFKAGNSEKMVSFPKGKSKVTFKIKENVLANEKYRINTIVEAYGKGVATMLYHANDAHRFTNRGADFGRDGLVHPEFITEYGS